MNHKSGIIATSLIICALAGPACAELSDSGAVPSAEATGGQNAVYSLLDKYAAEGQSGIPSPVSETSIISALTKTGAPMNAYYSSMGSDSKEVVASVSAASPYFNAPHTGQQAETAGAAPPLATFAAGNVVIGSGAVVSGESVAPLAGVSSSPIVSNTNSTPIVVVQDIIQPQETVVPIPLPFFLFGSGLASLMAFKRRTVQY